MLFFASLGATAQGESSTQFRVDYLRPSGAIGFYHPDWVVVQKTEAGEVNWIIGDQGPRLGGHGGRGRGLDANVRRYPDGATTSSGRQPDTRYTSSDYCLNYL